jgi:hypothetical protein
MVVLRAFPQQTVLESREGSSRHTARLTSWDMTSGRMISAPMHELQIAKQHIFRSFLSIHSSSIEQTLKRSLATLLIVCRYHISARLIPDWKAGGAARSHQLSS